MNQPTSSPVVLVTGITSGIGLALARKLWDMPYRVVCTVREGSRKNIAAEKFHENERFLIRILDLTRSGQITALISEIEQRWGGVDILINNAGISYRTVLEEMSEEDELQQMQVNYFGPMALTRLVLPSMRKKRRGRIINVSSVGGMMAMPTMGSYSASKFALEGASEALWYEVKPWGIHVSLIQPGFIHSSSFRNVYQSAKAKETCAKGGPYKPYYQHMSKFVEKIMVGTFATTDSIACKIISVMESESPPLRVPATVDAYLFSILRRLVPRRFYHWFLYRNLPGISQWGAINED